MVMSKFRVAEIVSMNIIKRKNMTTHHLLNLASSMPRMVLDTVSLWAEAMVVVSRSSSEVRLKNVPLEVGSVIQWSKYKQSFVYFEKVIRHL